MSSKLRPCFTARPSQIYRAIGIIQCRDDLVCSQFCFTGLGLYIHMDEWAFSTRNDLVSSLLFHRVKTIHTMDIRMSGSQDQSFARYGECLGFSHVFENYECSIVIVIWYVKLWLQIWQVWAMTKLQPNLWNLKKFRMVNTSIESKTKHWNALKYDFSHALSQKFLFSNFYHNMESYFLQTLLSDQF